MPSTLHRCYIDDETRSCREPASYEARLTWTAGLMLLCEAHAQRERERGDVTKIRTLRDRSI